MTSTFAQTLRAAGALAGVIAALTITALTIPTGGTLTNADITDKQVWFSSNGVARGDVGLTFASSTDRLFASNVSSTSIGTTGPLGVGTQPNSSTGMILIDGGNVTNRRAIYIQNSGAGTGGIFIGPVAGGTISYGDYTGSTFNAVDATNRAMRFRTSNNGSDPTARASFEFSSDGGTLPATTTMRIGGGSGQTGNLIEAFRENTSSTAVFRVSAAGSVFATSVTTGIGTAASPALNAGGNGGFGWLDSSSPAIFSAGVRKIYLNSVNANFDINVVPGANNAYDLGAGSVMWRNIYATGTEIIFGGITAPSVSADFVCWSATGTLRHQAVNCTVSSERFKTNIQELNDEELMAKVRKLQPIMYNWKPGMGDQDKVEEGFSAEKVATIDPSLVVFEETTDEEWITFMDATYPSAIIRKDGKVFVPKTIDYARISVLNTGAIQNMDDRLARLEWKVSLFDRILNFFKNLNS